MNGCCQGGGGVARGADAADTKGWRRPYRRTHAAPKDAFLMAPPVPHGDELVWVGSTGYVYTLPMYRVAGLYAPANGEFNTPVFTMPEGPLWVNADARWQAPLGTTYQGVQGCDEGCAAYVFAAVLDAATGDEIAGYGAEDSHVLMNTTGLRLPLLWNASSSSSRQSGSARSDPLTPPPPTQPPPSTPPKMWHKFTFACSPDTVYARQGPLRPQSKAH